MDEKTEPPVMADMMALKITGPTLVFLRARSHMPTERLHQVAEHLKQARSDGQLREFDRVKFIVLPCEFDIMAMGDVELERAGLARLESAAGT